MVKKILSTVLGCMAVILVLLLGAVLVLGNEDFFGRVITLLLCVLLGIIALFVLFLMVTTILDAVRKRRFDEDLLNEHLIEQILSGEEPKTYRTGKTAAILAQRREPAGEKQARKKEAQEQKASRKKAEAAARKRAEETAQRRKQEAEKEKQEAKAQKRADEQAQAAAQARAAKPDEDEKRRTPAKAGAPTSQAPAQSAPDDAPTEQALQERQRLDAEAAAVRKAQAIASARKQAEAIAVARRRAAQAAARTQAFAPIDPNNLPTFNNTVIGQLAEVADGHSPLSPPPMPPRGGDNIWDKMQVRQSAAPALGRTGHLRPASGALSTGRITGEIYRTGQMYLTTSGFAAQRPAGATGGWTPAKLPDAWKNDTAQRKIPGDMTYMRTQPLPAINGEETAGTAAAAGPKSVPSAAERNGAIAATMEGRAPAPAPATGASQAAPLSPEQPPPLRPGYTGAFRPAAGSTVQAPRPQGQTAQTPRQGPPPFGAPRPHAPPYHTAGWMPPAPFPDERRPRGRPPKPADPEELNQPKRPRGRPPKPIDPEEPNRPKRPRGRPPKPIDPEELNRPKRPRGRPRKSPLPGEEED